MAANQNRVLNFWDDVELSVSFLYHDCGWQILKYPTSILTRLEYHPKPIFLSIFQTPKCADGTEWCLALCVFYSFEVMSLRSLKLRGDQECHHWKIWAVSMGSSISALPKGSNNWFNSTKRLRYQISKYPISRKMSDHLDQKDVLKLIWHHKVDGNQQKFGAFAVST